MIEAIQFNDPTRGWVERLSRTAAGDLGERYYRVNTMDAFRAIDQPAGLPNINDPWSQSASAVLATEITTEYLGGLDGANGEDGVTIVLVRYGTPAAFGSLPPPGVLHTEIVPHVATATVYHDVRHLGPATPQYAGALHNGEGVAREFGAFEALVHAYPGDATALNWPRLLQLCRECPVNDTAIILPRVYGAPLDFPCPAGTLRYRTARLATRGGTSLEVTHVLHAAGDHIDRWWRRDERGIAYGEVINSHIYPEGNLQGLW